MRAYGFAAAAALALGCGKDRVAEGEASAFPAPTGQASAQAACPPCPCAASAAPTPERAPPPATLPEAVEVVRPLMADTQNAFNEGGGKAQRELAELWARRGYTWAELQALPETTYANVRKDADAERGKRLCVRGMVGQIQAIKLDAGKAHMSLIGLDGGSDRNAIVVALGGTGALQDRSWARFCGVTTGRHKYDNARGGVSHGVGIVGLFDLPENRAAPAASAR